MIQIYLNKYFLICICSSECERQGELIVKPAGQVMQQHHLGIMDMCWAPVSGSEGQDNSHVLMSLLGLVGQSVATIILRKINPDASGK